jgi:hypothetical protein
VNALPPNRPCDRRRTPGPKYLPLPSASRPSRRLDRQGSILRFRLLDRRTHGQDVLCVSNPCFSWVRIRIPGPLVPGFRSVNSAPFNRAFSSGFQGVISLSSCTSGTTTAARPGASQRDANPQLLYSPTPRTSPASVAASDLVISLPKTTTFTPSSASLQSLFKTSAAIRKVYQTSANSAFSIKNRLKPPFGPVPLCKSLLSLHIPHPPA